MGRPVMEEVVSLHLIFINFFLLSHYASIFSDVKFCFHVFNRVQVSPFTTFSITDQALRRRAITTFALRFSLDWHQN